MSINRNRVSASRFLSSLNKVGNAAIARVECVKNTGECSFCFPHGHETFSPKTGEPKGKDAKATYRPWRRTKSPSLAEVCVGKVPAVEPLDTRTPLEVLADEYPEWTDHDVAEYNQAAIESLMWDIEYQYYLYLGGEDDNTDFRTMNQVETWAERREKYPEAFGVLGSDMTKEEPSGSVMTEYVRIKGALIEI